MRCSMFKVGACKDFEDQNYAFNKEYLATVFLFKCFSSPRLRNTVQCAYNVKSVANVAYLEF